MCMGTEQSVHGEGGWIEIAKKKKKGEEKVKRKREGGGKEGMGLFTIILTR